MTGFMATATPDITPLLNFATSRDFCMAILLGTSSPKIRVKYARIMVITTTDMVSSAASGIP